MMLKIKLPVTAILLAYLSSAYSNEAGASPSYEEAMAGYLDAPPTYGEAMAGYLDAPPTYEQATANDQNHNPGSSKIAETISGIAFYVVGFHLLDKALETTDRQANDHLCGSLNIQIPGDMSIHSVLMKQGSIQNQFQYQYVEEGLYVPKEENTKILEIRQLTGFLPISRAYPLSYPIDIELTLSQPGGINKTTYIVQKGTCNSLQAGRVKAELKEGNPLDYHVQDSELDDQMTPFLHGRHTEFYTPAHLIIPAIRK